MDQDLDLRLDPNPYHPYHPYFPFEAGYTDSISTSSLSMASISETMHPVPSIWPVHDSTDCNVDWQLAYEINADMGMQLLQTTLHENSIGFDYLTNENQITLFTAMPQSWESGEGAVAWPDVLPQQQKTPCMISSPSAYGDAMEAIRVDLDLLGQSLQRRAREQLSAITSAPEGEVAVRIDQRGSQRAHPKGSVDRRAEWVWSG
jgi:hypothetical protein